MPTIQHGNNLKKLTAYCIILRVAATGLQHLKLTVWSMFALDLCKYNFTKILTRKKVHLEIWESLFHPHKTYIKCTLGEPGILLGVFGPKIKNFYPPVINSNLSNYIEPMKGDSTFAIPVPLDFSGMHAKFKLHLVINYNDSFPWLEILQHIPEQKIMLLIT